MNESTNLPNAADVVEQDSMDTEQDMGTSVPGAEGTDTSPEGEESFDSIEAIEAAADAERAKQGLPTLDESQSMPVDMGPDLYGPFRNMFDYSYQQQAYLKGLSDLQGMAESILWGLGDGTKNTLKTAGEVGFEAGTTLLKTVMRVFGSDQQTLDKLDNPEQDQAILDQLDGIPNFAEVLGIKAPDSAAENLLGTATPIIAGYMLGGKALEGLGYVSKLNNLRLPGVLGQGVGRTVTINGTKGLIEMLKGGAAAGIVLDEDSENFADMLKSLSSRDDAIGSVGRTWLSAVPGASMLTKDEDDHPITKRFKNALDAAYGELVGPMVYMSLRAARVGQLFAKGKVGREVLEQAVRDVETVQSAATKFDKDVSREEALDIIFPTGAEPGEPLQAGIKRTKPLPDAGLDTSTDVGDVVDETAIEADEKLKPTPDTKAPTEPAAESLPSIRDLPTGERLQHALGLDPNLTLKRISEAKTAAEAAEKEAIGDLRAYQTRFNTMANRAGQTVNRAAFDDKGYLKHLTEVADNPAAFERALEDWGQFINLEDGEPLPSLLSPKQLGAWKDTPMDVTGNVIKNIKRLTTTNPKRKKEAIRFLADMMGNGLDTDNVKLAKKMLKEGGLATAEVDKASRLMLMNNMFLHNNVIPDLGRVLNVLSVNPEDATMQRNALMLIKQVHKFQETNKNLRSAFGRGLQSSTIDPKMEQKLVEVYGPEQYKAYFGLNPKTVTEQAEAAGLKVADDTVDSGSYFRSKEQAEAHLEAIKGNTVNARIETGDFGEMGGWRVVSDPALTNSELAQIQLLQRRWGVTNPKEHANLVSSIYRVGTHPVWQGLASVGNFSVDMTSNMLMSSMLFNPMTWSRVLQGATTGVLYDSASQLIGSKLLSGLEKGSPNLYEAVFHGTPIDSLTHDTMQFGATFRLLSLPYSLLVAGKSFVRPSWQELYGLGTTLYKTSPILGPEMIAKSFGDDFATKVFASGGGWTSRILKFAGAGLGFPQHMFGSFETMINHGALSSRLAEVLYTQARTGGLKPGGAGRIAARAVGLNNKDAVDFVFEHLPDLMEDAIVANHVPRGNVALRNKLGITVEELRNYSEQAGMNADYTSLRETGREAGSPLATTRLSDTYPFQLAEGITKFATGIPAIGPVARASVIPFGKVSANMAGRAVSPAQALLSMVSRASGLPGMPSAYIDEVMGGLHGPHRQAQLLGHTLISTALFGMGAASLYMARQNGRDIHYPLDKTAEMEASNERGVRFGETLLPDGSTVTTTGFNPFINQFNQGAYASWILGEYGLTPFLNSAAQTGKLFGVNPGISDADQLRGSEALKHGQQWLWDMVPVAPMFQGMRELFGSFTDGSGNTFMGAWGASMGNAIERPFRIPDLLPGRQVPGRSVPIKDDGFARAFLTGAGGFSGEPNANRITAYNLGGEPIADKYDPDKGIDQFLEAFGLPSRRPYDSSALGQFLGELEDHGIAFSTLDRKQNLKVGDTAEGVDINLQHFYNPKTKEHLWDVYNRFIKEFRGPSWVNFDTKEKPLKVLLDEYAQTVLDTERGDAGSRIVGGKRVLSLAADRMQTNLAVVRDLAKERLQAYLLEHTGEFKNSEGKTLEEYAKLMYDIGRTPIPTEQPGTVESSVETSDDE